MSTLKALLQGYIYFKVDGLGFFCYHNAIEYIEFLNDLKTPNIKFVGYHILDKWVDLVHLDNLRNEPHESLQK